MEIIKNVNEMYGVRVSTDMVKATEQQQLQFGNLYKRIYNKRKAVMRAKYIRDLCAKMVGHILTETEILARLRLVTKNGVDTYYFDGQLLVVL